MSKPIQIRTLNQLQCAALKRRSVFMPIGNASGSSPTPAAFLYSMPARTVHNWMNRGLYLYQCEHAAGAQWKAQWKKKFSKSKRSTRKK